MKKAASTSQGFSLVEVALALGVASIALLSVVGLLGAAMDTSGTAGQDTSLAAMAGLVAGDLHAAPFDALGLASPRKPGSVKLTLPEQLEDSIYYFTQDGVPITDADAATRPDAHFECVVRKMVDSVFRSASDGTDNLVRVEMRFTWPVSADPDPEKRTGRASFHASIARY